MQFVVCALRGTTRAKIAIINTPCSVWFTTNLHEIGARHTTWRIIFKPNRSFVEATYCGRRQLLETVNVTRYYYTTLYTDKHTDQKHGMQQPVGGNPRSLLEYTRLICTRILIGCYAHSSVVCIATAWKTNENALKDYKGKKVSTNSARFLGAKT